MKKPSEGEDRWEEMRQSIIGLGEKSLKKSYYPELQKRIGQLEQANAALLAEIREREAAEARQLQAERQLRQAQKLQAIGTLAGGIAHDFNNILSAIIGYAELARIHSSSAVGEGQELMFADLDGILKSAERAKGLVRRILSFSSHHDGDLQPVDLSRLLNDTIDMLRAMIPTTITIRSTITCGNCLILADSTQLQQVLMNLGTNGYHAMRERGGTLDFVLGNMDVNADNDRYGGLELPWGTYLHLQVIDTGCGMDQETLDRIFDPYFTTKRVDGGTGLGLSVVHGIVSAHQGHIIVSSKMMQGTVVELFFPLLDTTFERTEELLHSNATGGTEHILIVDDEIALTRIMQGLLENLGYTVTATTSPLEAIALLTSEPTRYDLLISDMNMPKMNGIEMITQLREFRQDLPVILCTGFSEHINETTVHRLGRARYIMKPVVRDDLDMLIRSLLDG